MLTDYSMAQPPLKQLKYSVSKTFMAIYGKELLVGLWSMAFK